MAAAVTAGVVDWLRLRREPVAAAGQAGPAAWAEGPGGVADDADDGHRIFLDPWAEDEDEDGEQGSPPPPGPASLP